MFSAWLGSPDIEAALKQPAFHPGEAGRARLRANLKSHAVVSFFRQKTPGLRKRVRFPTVRAIAGSGSAGAGRAGIAPAPVGR